MTVLTINEDLKSQLLSGSYKVKCEILEKKVTELERRIEQLELALELYRKDTTRES